MKKEQPINETRDLGFMLYDLDFEKDPDNPPAVFRAFMKQGVINTDRREVGERMILQSLKGYYDRVAADPGSGIPRPGWEYKEICFLIVVDDKGNFIDVEDTRELVEGRLVPKAFLVPQSAPRSGTKSYQTTFLLWDHGDMCWV